MVGTLAMAPASDNDGGGADGGGRSPWAYLGLGFEIAVPLLLGVYGGYRLDLWLGTQPWLVVVGAMVGMFVGFYGFFKTILPAGKGR